MIFCRDCKKKITINYRQEKKNELLKNHLNRNSYRTIQVENKIDKSTACGVVNHESAELISSNNLTKILRPQNYCGIILIDGKYVPVKETSGRAMGFVPRSAKRGNTKKGLVTIACIDYLTHDVPIFETCLSENSFDIERIFLQLKELGYPLKVIICDETMGQIAEIAKRVFPKVVIQICLTHYSKTIERTFVCNSAKRTYKSLQKQLDYLGESPLISTRHHDRKKARGLTNEMADLESEYGYLWIVQSLFHELFWQVKNSEELNIWEDKFNETISRMDLKNYPHAKKIQDRYQDYYEKRDGITASILHPELNIPKTTNLIEGFNSTTLEIRFTTIRGFEKEEYAKNYINALILKYRFHKFTDCKKQFKHLNKKSPLQIANPMNDFGFNFENGDWIKFCKLVGQCVIRP
jgi:hypothetical protein